MSALPPPQSQLQLRSVAALVTVQDGGRPGFAHHGVPRGGPLVPELLWAANVAVGNALGEAALEIFGAIVVVAVGAGLALDLIVTAVL